jgi:hypothetical protein
MQRTRIALVGIACALALPAAPPATAIAGLHSCRPVRDPYPGTRYAHVDLTRIRTSLASCATARHVARRAHRKALATAPPEGGIRRLTWHGWRVRGDIRPAHDRYVARKGTRVVRWRF